MAGTRQKKETGQGRGGPGRSGKFQEFRRSGPIFSLQDKS